MKFLLILFIIVLLIQFIKYLNSKENFDNNCFHNYIQPNFTLKISDLFKLDENGDFDLDDANGNIQYEAVGNDTVFNSYKISDLSDNLYQDISTILQPTFNNVLLNKTNCELDY